MIPLVGLELAGATLTEHDDLAPGAAVLGRPVWGPRQWLADLELRLGLPAPREPDAVRVQRWSRRLAEVAAIGAPRFYARSYEVDPLGTATALLAWRDELVTAGWNGDAIAGGGPRLDTLAEVEAGAEMPPGPSDRLRRVERELEVAPILLYDALRLAEGRALWPGRWRRVLDRLEALGTPIQVVDPSFDGATGSSDLARAQRALRGEAPASKPALTGDGSLVLLRAETSWELAHAVAAQVRAWGEPSVAVLRGGDTHALDRAMVAQGLGSQGVSSASRWRPALQVLSLAVELAYEPRDPYRVLELLTLPTGPFEGAAGRALASALAEMPGIGGPPWVAAKALLPQQDHARIAEWLEAPGCDPETGASREALLAVADRVRAWARSRLVRARLRAMEEVTEGALAQVGLLGGALAQAQAFAEAVAHEPRERLDRVAARLLVDQLSASGHALTLGVERAGRVDPVDSPAALRRSRDGIVWWHCVAGTERRPPISPWRRAELAALRAAGVRLVDAGDRLAAESRSWSHPILGARRRLVLAMPRAARGDRLEPHPVWHELVARLGASDADVARITVDARDLLEGRGGALASPSVSVVDRGPLALPAARAVWTLSPVHLAPSTTMSASSLDALVGCPLKWVLNYRAGLRSGALGSIADGALLSGKLAHRLVEELHEARSLGGPDEVRAGVAARFPRMLREEGAVLLRAGMTFELSQLRGQIVTAVVRLAELLAASGLTVVEVESPIDCAWRGGELTGRIDLLLRDARGRDVVLDLKWGRSTYAGLLGRGLAIQLAVYAAARRIKTGASELPAAAYYALAKGSLLTTDGAPFGGASAIAGAGVAETWGRLERTVGVVERALASGRVPVTGVRRALPLLEALGVVVTERERHLDPPLESACKYCDYGPLCGKSWEAFA